MALDKVNLVDVQKHVEKIREYIRYLEPWVEPGGAHHIMVDAETLRDLLKCAATWCEVTEAVWFGKGEEKH